MDTVFQVGARRLLKKIVAAGCSKTPGCKAREILRNEAYI
jgi:hypothetical protein